MQDSIELAINSPVHDGTFQGLKEYLTDILAPDSLLLRRIVTGIETDNEGMVNDAVKSLSLYPDDIEKAVRDAVFAWIFSDRPG